MTTKVVDSTVSELLQGNSSVEYVAPETNPIATVPNETKNLVSSNPLFDFNAVHNGEACIESLDPKDKGTERQFRFTRALLCTLLGVKSENTITNHVETLINRGVLDVVKNLTTSPITNSNGASHETTLYDLKVFNYLVMRLDTDRAWEMKAKFNDVLVERETNPQPQSMMLPNFCNPAEAARAWADLYEKNQATELRALKAESERDEAIRTKAQIGSSREATAMNTASQKSKECKRLTAENAELKDAVGRGTNWHTVNMMTAEWKREFGHAPDWRQLKKFSADFPKEMKPVKDVEVKAVLPNGSEKINKVFRYHREAWAKYREYEENQRAKDKNVPNTKILDLIATCTEVEYF